MCAGGIVQQRRSFWDIWKRTVEVKDGEELTSRLLAFIA